MIRVVFNQKGGVGKSSIATNLAAISAAQGFIFLGSGLSFCSIDRTMKDLTLKILIPITALGFYPRASSCQYLNGEHDGTHC